MLLSVAFALPGAWWFLHQKRDKSGQSMDRHWGIIATVSIVAFIAGSALATNGDPADDAEAAVETTSAPSQTSTTTSLATSLTSTSQVSTAGAELTSAPPSAVRPAAVELAPAPRRNATLAPVPVPAYTPPPAPAYTPPPAPASVYYANCAAARAAGAAPVYAGSPGYGTHLDRDGDGIGCE